MQTQEQQPQGNFIQAALALAGMFGALGMCFMDAYTTFTGLGSYFATSNSDLGKFWIPLFLSTLTIGFTAYSTEFIDEAFQGKIKGGKPGVFVIILLLCVVYDFITGLGGTLILMTGVETALEAFIAASSMQKIVASGLSVMMVMSPFIVGKFLYKVKEDIGIIGKFFRGFGS